MRPRRIRRRRPRPRGSTAQQSLSRARVRTRSLRLCGPLQERTVACVVIGCDAGRQAAQGSARLGLGHLGRDARTPMASGLQLMVMADAFFVL